MSAVPTVRVVVTYYYYYYYSRSYRSVFAAKAMSARVAPEHTAETTETHDRLVIEALEQGVVVLISCAWLRSQENAVVLLRRQELPAAAVLSPQEAAAIFQSRERRVATLSYGKLLENTNAGKCTSAWILNRVFFRSFL